MGALLYMTKESEAFHGQKQGFFLLLPKNSLQILSFAQGLPQCYNANALMFKHISQFWPKTSAISLLLPNQQQFIHFYISTLVLHRNA